MTQDQPREKLFFEICNSLEALTSLLYLMKIAPEDLDHFHYFAEREIGRMRDAVKAERERKSRIEILRESSPYIRH